MELGHSDIVCLRSGMGTLPDDELPELPVESDIHRALDRWSPQAVIVCNPTALHLPLAIPAAEFGCDLLIEKPISHSLEGIDRLRQAVRQGGGKVLIGYQYRHNVGLQQVQKLLDSGAMGRTIAARAHWGEDVTGWHPWEDYRQSYSVRRDLGGGALLTLSHPFDYLRWLVGEPRTVWGVARSSEELETDVDDVADVGLDFDSGAIGSVHLNYFQRPAVHRLELSGTQGHLRWDGGDSAVELFQAAAGQPRRFPAPKGYNRNEMFVSEMRHFVDLVQHKVDPICNLDDGVRALELALAARQASQTGRSITVDNGPTR